MVLQVLLLCDNFLEMFHLVVHGCTLLSLDDLLLLGDDVFAQIVLLRLTVGTPLLANASKFAIPDEVSRFVATFCFLVMHFLHFDLAAFACLVIRLFAFADHDGLAVFHFSRVVSYDFIPVCEKRSTSDSTLLLILEHDLLFGDGSVILLPLSEQSVLLFNCPVDNCAPLLKFLDSLHQVHVLEVRPCHWTDVLPVHLDDVLVQREAIQVMCHPRVQLIVHSSAIIHYVVELLAKKLVRGRCVDQVVEHVNPDEVRHLCIHDLAVEKLEGRIHIVTLFVNVRLQHHVVEVDFSLPNTGRQHILRKVADGIHLDLVIAANDYLDLIVVIRLSLT